MDPGEDPEDTLRTHRSREKTFIFDTVFDQHASQVPSAHCPLVPLGQAVLTVLTKPCRPLGRTVWPDGLIHRSSQGFP